MLMLLPPAGLTANSTHSQRDKVAWAVVIYHRIDVAASRGVLGQGGMAAGSFA